MIQVPNVSVAGDKCRMAGNKCRMAGNKCRIAGMTGLRLVCSRHPQLVPLSRHFPRLVCRQGPPHFECGQAT
jgi:hypothetical protein